MDEALGQHTAMIRIKIDAKPRFSPGAGGTPETVSATEVPGRGPVVRVSVLF